MRYKDINAYCEIRVDTLPPKSTSNLEELRKFGRSTVGKLFIAAGTQEQVEPLTPARIQNRSTFLQYKIPVVPSLKPKPESLNVGMYRVREVTYYENNKM